ncbi:unnamed protein product [Paramecium sonneborni]|uniref:Uncharacterized protein n=1 Tax=Paramecium sonneborni TaxID=65129 RepID=A0A8S1MKS9_9CILI|nr:unnamed protein product [Paramecium sonneborni]
MNNDLSVKSATQLKRSQLRVVPPLMSCDLSHQTIRVHLLIMLVDPPFVSNEQLKFMENWSLPINFMVALECVYVKLKVPSTQ